MSVRPDCSQLKELRSNRSDLSATTLNDNSSRVRCVFRPSTRRKAVRTADPTIWQCTVAALVCGQAIPTGFFTGWKPVPRGRNFVGFVTWQGRFFLAFDHALAAGLPPELRITRA